jgi:hypothetical protein
MSAKGYAEKISRMENRSKLFAVKNVAYWNFVTAWQAKLHAEAWDAWKKGEGRKWFFIAVARWLEVPISFK